jgi:hypothetical protein
MKGVKQLSAGHYISKIQSDHQYFDLQLICLFEDGKPVSNIVVVILTVVLVLTLNTRFFRV